MFPTHRPVTSYMCHSRAFRSLSSELKCGQLGRLRQRRQGATLLVPTAATCFPRTKACRNSACTAPSSRAVNRWSCQSCQSCQQRQDSTQTTQSLVHPTDIHKIWYAHIYTELIYIYIYIYMYVSKYKYYVPLAIWGSIKARLRLYYGSIQLTYVTSYHYTAGCLYNQVEPSHYYKWNRYSTSV